MAIALTVGRPGAGMTLETLLKVEGGQGDRGINAAASSPRLCRESPLTPWSLPHAPLRGQGVLFPLAPEAPAGEGTSPLRGRVSGVVQKGGGTVKAV